MRNCLLLTTTLIFISTTVIAKDYYLIPHDVKCVVKKKEKITYCKDLNGQPITGEMRRYHDNNLIHLYPMENGVLNGTAYTYFSNGNIYTEKKYNKGNLNGISKEYYKSGIIKEEISYLNGKKEGVSKMYHENGNMLSQTVYKGNKANGETRIYDENQTMLYTFKNQNDKLISGTYFYKTENNKINQTTIPEIIISAINNACLQINIELTESQCAATYNNNLTDCNQEWREKNREKVREYLRECKKTESSDE